jgi:calcineurin-like phosphoesterase
MVGPSESIIGNEIDGVLRRFVTGMPARLPVPEEPGPVQFNAVLVDVDETTAKARSIVRVDKEWNAD